LTAETSTNIVELATLSDRSSNPIAALAFTSDGTELLAVHGIEGIMERWRVKDVALLETTNVGPVGMAAVSFDDQAQLMAIGAGRTEPAIKAGYDVDLAGVRVWDTRAGALIVDTSKDDHYVTDVALSSDGQWLAKIYPGGITFLDADTGIYDFGFSWEAYESPIQPSITTAIFDPAGSWVAYAADLGWVKIDEWDPKVPGLPWVLQDGGEKKTPTPLALAIDPSRHWMAMVTTESLVMWDLQARFRKEVLKESVPFSPVADLVFSPDGSLLAVGTGGGWQLWSVKDKKLLLEGSEPTYAVTFSPDGRLFAWGDIGGVVHLWGVRSQ
jgi:WD40 repeat protein